MPIHYECEYACGRPVAYVFFLRNRANSNEKFKYSCKQDKNELLNVYPSTHHYWYTVWHRPYIPGVIYEN